MRPLRSIVGFVAPVSALCAATTSAKVPQPDYQRSDATRVSNLPFSDSVAANGLVFLNNQIGNRPGEGKVVDGGLAAELEQALRNIDAVLKVRGLSRANIVMCTLTLRDVGDWPELNKHWAASFPAERMPARNVIGAALPLGAAVGVACIASAQH